VNRSELWALLVKRNPRLSTGPIIMAPSEFKRFYDLVWDQSEKHALKSDTTNPLMDFLNGFTKGKQ